MIEEWRGGCSTVKVTFGFSEHYNEQGEPEVETRKSSVSTHGGGGGRRGGGGGCWLEVISNRICRLLVFVLQVLQVYKQEAGMLVPPDQT